MIVPMKKYTLLVYHKEYDQFLDSMRELGVLHIKEQQKGLFDDESLREKINLIKQLNEAKRFLEKYVDPKAKISIGTKDGQTILDELEQLRLADEKLKIRIENLDKDRTLLEPWGEFSWDYIANLKKEGIEIRFFNCSQQNWKPEWESQYNAFVIAQQGVNVAFVTITKIGEEISVDADAVQLPKQSLGQIETETANLKAQRAEIVQSFQKLSVGASATIEKAKQIANQDIDLGNAHLNTAREAENRMAILEGFIPINKEEEFVQFIASQAIYYVAEKPKSTERVPVLLKNNWFNKLFETIGELYTLPNHNELDLTPFYAPFYMLFFGFCLGDFGYGLVLALVGFIMTSHVSPTLKNPIKLLGFLGLSTMLFGILSGTAFGMNLYELRWWFYADLDDMIKAQHTTVNQYLFYGSIALGGVQILFGMVVKAMNETHQNGIRYAFGTIGWLFIILAFAISIGLTKIGIDLATVNAIKYTMLGIGFIGAFIVSNPERNIFANMGFGIWDTYNMATGLLGDTLSYIRLFALGISSSILGYVFNSLAFSLAPDNIILKVIVVSLILIIGHTLNFLMAILGSFVHPMRLTFVEFYKNAGFSGGGKKYNPFQKRVIS